MHDTHFATAPFEIRYLIFGGKKKIVRFFDVLK